MPDPPTLEEILSTEFSQLFVNLMRNRMVVSYHKYGPIAAGFPDRIDALECCDERVAKYRETGNAEWLVDAANFLMIEFMRPAERDAHFRATDSDESPGRARRDGLPRAARNVQVDSAVSRLRERFLRGD